MEFKKVIEERRSIRKYSSEGKPTREELIQMIQAAQEAPSWKNSQTGRYYCVTSEEMCSRFCEECLLCGNGVKAENAALIVTTFVKNRAGFQRDGSADNELGNGWGCYDLGLQNENLILKSAEIGYGTLIMGLRDSDKIREMLSIPQEEVIVAVIAVGKAEEEPARPKRKETEDIVKFF